MVLRDPDYHYTGGPTKEGPPMPGQRNPAQYRLCECICEKADEPMRLTWSRDRGWFEPITGSLAFPVVGRVLSWKYLDKPW